jgi:GDPmannose 4,6-dehydratase
METEIKNLKTESPPRIALITGITGQDGSYLAELLLDKNYIVYGIIRRSSSLNTSRIEHIFSKLQLRYGDVTDSSNLFSIFHEIQERMQKCGADRLEVYHLAAMSHVKVSFEVPVYTAEVDALGTLRMLEAVRESGIPQNKVRFYQASTSEMFGKVCEVPQTEKTPFYPRSPYGVAKVYAHFITRNYRESYNMFACSGILFNHESPRRGHNFVTRKVTLGIKNILKGNQDCLVMGNLDAKRDWGHAKDYVYGMWLMLQAELPKDYILSMNEQHSVREFIEKCFERVGKSIVWEGNGLNEVGKDKTTNQILVKVSDKYYRPAEVDILQGDSTLARTDLQWTPNYTFDALINEMVSHDCDLILLANRRYLY